MPLQPHSPPDCAFRTNQSSIGTVRIRYTHTTDTTPPLSTDTNHTSQTTHTNHPPPTHPPPTNPTTNRPPHTRNVVDRLCSGDNWMPCFFHFLSQPPRVKTAQCARLWQPFPRRVRQTRRHMRSAIYHESSRTRLKEERKCGVVWCMLYVLSCEFYVSTPIKCIMYGLHKQPVHTVSYLEKSVVEGLRLYSQTCCVEPFSTRNPCLVLSLILAIRQTFNTNLKWLSQHKMCHPFATRERSITEDRAQHHLTQEHRYVPVTARPCAMPPLLQLLGLASTSQGCSLPLARPLDPARDT